MKKPNKKSDKEKISVNLKIRPKPKLLNKVHTKNPRKNPKEFKMLNKTRNKAFKRPHSQPVNKDQKKSRIKLNNRDLHNREWKTNIKDRILSKQTYRTVRLNKISSEIKKTALNAVTKRRMRKKQISMMKTKTMKRQLKSDNKDGATSDDKTVTKRATTKELKSKSLKHRSNLQSSTDSTTTSGKGPNRSKPVKPNKQPLNKPNQPTTSNNIALNPLRLIKTLPQTFLSRMVAGPKHGTWVIQLWRWVLMTGRKRVPVTWKEMRRVRAFGAAATWEWRIMVMKIYREFNGGMGLRLVTSTIKALNRIKTLNKTLKVKPLEPNKSSNKTLSNPPNKVRNPTKQL